MIPYYDAVLALIPVTLVGISGSLVALGAELTAAVPIAALVTVSLIGHALFVNNPVDASRTTQRRSSMEFESAKGD